MFSSSTSGSSAIADGSQTDFEGSPIVSTVLIKGTPNTRVYWTSGGSSLLSNANGSTITFTPQYYSPSTGLPETLGSNFVGHLLLF
ncbi:MAG: hypothetical protein GKR88_05405 [Flavobacteriaceae bacterium]|nr:MAG: hypothetical protein GKR88_05405 [Flavobacteriaceae bacterium]